jgi:hypothetical protein
MVVELLIGAVRALVHHLLYRVVPVVVAHRRVHHQFEAVALAADDFNRSLLPHEHRLLIRCHGAAHRTGSQQHRRGAQHAAQGQRAP